MGDGRMTAVITYVDPRDPAWQSEFRETDGRLNNGTVRESVNAPVRFRSMGMLDLQVLAIRRFMPFVSDVLVVVSDESQAGMCRRLYPEMPEVRWVFHKDFIPREYLPTFNSHTIELYLWNIGERLGDYFIYFNDDQLPVAPMTREDFVSRDGRIVFTMNSKWRTGWYKYIPTGPSYGACCNKSARIAWERCVPGRGGAPQVVGFPGHEWPYIMHRGVCGEAFASLTHGEVTRTATQFRDYESNIAPIPYYSGWILHGGGGAVKAGTRTGGSTAVYLTLASDRLTERLREAVADGAVVATVNDSDKLDGVKFHGAVSRLRQWYSGRISEGGLHGGPAARNPEPAAAGVRWADYFDHIYCLHYTGHKNRMPGLLEELERVGISGSGIFSFHYAVNDPNDRYVEKAVPKMATKDEQNRAYVSIFINYSRILREALGLGYKRILVLEDDVRFLKDLGGIRGILEALPPDKGVVQLDKEPYGPGWEKRGYNEWAADHMLPGGMFVDARGAWFGSSACVAFTDGGMREILEVMAAKHVCPDRAFAYLKSYAVAHKSLAVQVMYDNGALQALFRKNMHNRAYRRQGLRYSDYNVPAGYEQDSDAPYTPGGAASRTPAKGGKRIHVYAIAKNEEAFVDGWVKSMSEADGIHVLDTGSTDSTVRRLREAGAHVETTDKYRQWDTLERYDELAGGGMSPWRFDTARNESMALCPDDTDIYVCTDLDERFEPGWRAKLERLWREAEAHGERPTGARYDYIWGWGADGEPSRKFRYEKIHDRDYEWVYPVHEVLRRTAGEEGHYIDTDIVLEHHPDPAKSRGLYLPLLELSVREDPDNDRNTHYLAREYSFRRDHANAVKWHEKYLSMKKGWYVERAASMRYLAESYSATGSAHMAELQWWRGCCEAPDHREAALSALRHCVTAENWKTAAMFARLMLRVKNPTSDYVTELSCWGPDALDLAGLALWYAGSRDEAVEVYKDAVARFPGNRRLADNLARCLPDAKSSAS